MRLDKLLADMQIGTRNKVKQLIRQGAVTVDGAVQTAPDLKVDPNRQKICCFGKDLRYTEYVYYMFYKPKGCVTAHRDAMHPTVMDYIDCGRRGLSPVGRLDLDTEGLLLITNDGELSHNLLSPANMSVKYTKPKSADALRRKTLKSLQPDWRLGTRAKPGPQSLKFCRRADRLMSASPLRRGVIIRSSGCLPLWVSLCWN